MEEDRIKPDKEDMDIRQKNLNVYIEIEGKQLWI